MNHGIFNFLVGIVLLVIPCAHQRSLPKDPTYIGAVVEYFPCNSADNTSMLMNNANYQHFISQANESNADIIVFPEIGLVGYDGFVEDLLIEVPDPKDNIVPCKEYPYGNVSLPLARLSCDAEMYGIYVVANIPEKVPCSKETDKNCPSSGRYRYNTNVVLDRQGTVIARYRKYNLFDEGDTNVPEEPEAVYFDTDFDVRFGTFTCFDILFARPAIDLVLNYGVTDIAFPTAWFSELPFLTALQAQQGFAYAHDVNFLASGYNNITVGSGGSGIYLGRNKRNVEMPEETTSQLLVFEIPKKAKRVPPAKPQLNVKSTYPGLEPNIHARIVRTPKDNYNEYILSVADDDFDPPLDCTKNVQDQYSLNLLTDHSLNVLESHQINFDEDKGKFEKTICDLNEFCCNFTISYKKLKQVSHNYRAVVFNGVRGYGSSATGGVQLCSILMCTGSDITDCSFRLKDKDFGYTFEEIYITGDFLKVNASQLPDSLTDTGHLLPLETDQFEFSVDSNDDTNRVHMELKSKQSNLMAFGIYGRVFSRDGEPPTEKSGSMKLENTILLTLISLFAVEYLRR